MPKKKVIFFTNILLPSSQTFVKEQACNLKNWEPVFVGETDDINGLTLEGFEKIILLSAKYNYIEKLIYRICRWISIASPLTLKRLQTINADLIHAHFGPSGTNIFPYAKALNIPLIITLHGYDITIRKEWWENQNNNFRMRNYPKQLHKISKDNNVFFITVSNAIKNKAINFGIQEKNIDTCYIGVDTKKFSPCETAITERKKRIVFVGRIVEKKGIEDLIKAFALTKKEITDAELVIIGYGELKEKMEKLCDSLNIEVNFLEKMNSQEIINELNKAMIFCLPSTTAKNGDSEGLPISILEAQSVGIPVITTFHSGNIEAIIDNCSGFLSTEGDYLSISEQMKTILLDKNLLIKFSTAARKNVLEKFDINTCTHNLEKIYNKHSGEINEH